MINNLLNLTPTFIIIKLSDEIIIKDVKNHENITDVKNFMIDNFGINNYYILSTGLNEYSLPETCLTIINKQKEINIFEDLYMLYFYDKELEIYKKIIYEIMPFHFGEPEFEISNNNVLNYYEMYDFKKPISAEKYKYKITGYIMNNFQEYISVKYFDWLCKIHYNSLLKNGKGIIREDYDKIKNILIDFDKPEVKSLIKKAGYNLDINSYETDSDLFQIVDEVYYTKLSELELKDTSKLVEARTIIEDNNWIVVVPENHYESVKLSRYGGMTNWCTAADSEDGKSNFNNYTENGIHKLYIFIDKNNPAKKYQWSEFTNDFLDKNDNEFEVEDIFDLEFIKLFYEKNKLIFYEKNNLIPTKFGYILIKNNYYLDYFINIFAFKAAVAEQGYGLDILIHDEFASVRLAVVEQGYGLDILINDKIPWIRKAVAKQGYGLDILIHDEDKDVRKAVAKQGYGLDILIHDEDKDVRKAVAKQGYGLDILIHDKDKGVKKVALSMLK